MIRGFNCDFKKDMAPSSEFWEKPRDHYEVATKFAPYFFLLFSSFDQNDQKLFVIGWVYVDWNVILKRLWPHLASLGRNHEMMSAAVLDEGFARKVMIASHDSGGELIASQSNVCCWQLFGSPHVELYIYFPKLLSTQFLLRN